MAEQTLIVASLYSHILALAIAFGNNFLPRVAAKPDVAQISEITRLDCPDTFERPIYANNVMQQCSRPTARNSQPCAAPASTQLTPSGARLLWNSLAQPPTLASRLFVGRELAKSSQPELTAAKFIVSGGRGTDSGDNFKLLEPPGATVGCGDDCLARGRRRRLRAERLAGRQDHRAISVLRRWYPGRDLLFGQHKELEAHLAINKDLEAPIFSVTDFSLVGDVFEIMPQLSSALDKVCLTQGRTDSSSALHYGGFSPTWSSVI